MSNVRIVCAHDAVKLAEMLTRLLEAEEHRVRLSYGRRALSELEDASRTQDAVVLIWSPNARSQTYMIEWARTIEPARLVEISCATGDWPAIKRVAPVIDFTPWRGERGARAWKLLNERLSAVARTYAPQKPIPVKAFVAMGFAGAAAAAGALMVRVDASVETGPAPASLTDVAVTDFEAGMGGPLTAIEPASMDDGQLRTHRYREFAPIAAPPAEPLARLPELPELELRDPTMLERLQALNPLRREGGDPEN